MTRQLEEPQQNSETNMQRLFYSLLIKVGADGKYQYVSLFILAAVYMTTSSATFFNPYLFYQNPYQCEGLTERQCNQYVCSLSYQLRGPYLLDAKPMFIDSFGQYRCQRNTELNIYQTIVYAMGVVGIIISVYLNSLIRKKVLIEISLLIIIVDFIILLVTKNLYVMIAALSLTFACLMILFQLIVCFAGEMFLEEKRSKATMVLFVFFSLGSLANGALFGYFQWKSIFVYYFMIPLLICLIGIKFYIKQTPFDLVVDFPAQYAYDSFAFIARQNHCQDIHKISVKQIKQIQQEYQQSLKKNGHDQIEVLDLIRFKSLRSDVIYISIIQLLAGFTYQAPILAVNQFSANIYVNGVIFSSATLLSSIMCYFVIEDFSRKNMMNYSIILSLIFLLPTFLNAKCKTDCSDDLKWAQSLSIFCFRIIIEVSYQAFYFIKNQIFPTQVRSLAFLVSISFGNIYKVLIPLVSQMNHKVDYFMPITYVGFSIIQLLILTQIRETVGIPPPQIVQELAFKHKKQLYD